MTGSLFPVKKKELHYLQDISKIATVVAHKLSYKKC